MTVIYICRHADPDRSVAIDYQRWPGPPLTPKGVYEAKMLGRVLSYLGVGGRGNGALIFSPMQRTTDTALFAVNAYPEDSCKPFLFCDHALTESQVGESTDSIRKRMLLAFQSACQWDDRHPGSRSAIVTHGGPITVLLMALGMPDADLVRYMGQCDNGSPLPTAGVMRVDVDVDRIAFDMVFDPRLTGDYTDIANNMAPRPF